ncbi:SIMPL domain-containing protein [Actinocrinis puniceicyclus]|uniref:SIMPL domain-containing protein n=1 Tax=Actinocrinis puniceicyclus TaxID=977794 RepID=A0A8J7WPB3_9ACTN|nr:SIMPL domain-containing protein [Actinocrinis puniceicyclus]MBS2964370.1 SIMPL domain-containing protein [Actinocrinis puniceicyclus]
MQSAPYEPAEVRSAGATTQSVQSVPAPAPAVGGSLPDPMPRPRSEARAAAVISVRGEATMLVDPEVADLTVSVTAHARDRREAFERLVKRNDEVLDLVRSYGDSVDRVESTGLSVAPEMRRGKDEKIRSYAGTVRVRVTVADLAILGELIARLTEVEASALEGPFWRLRRSSPIYRETRARAVAEAVARARDYAEALGSRITGLIELADTGLSSRSVTQAPRPGGPVVYSARAVGAAQPEPAALDLEPQQQTVYASVEASFQAAQPEFPLL